jgi:hypothetical protein
MSTNSNIPISGFHILEKTSPSAPPLAQLERDIHEVLGGLNLPAGKLRGRRIAVSVGSRGIASLQEIVRSICGWVKAQGGQPFVFPAMGSHGGATAEGQRKVLEDYGITPESVGAEVRSSMDAVLLGTTPEGFRVFMDRNAWESDGVIVMNRVKPHTDFTGKIESGLLKMMSVGMGKIAGASEVHHWGWKFGFEKVLRAMSAVTLGSGKILAGLAVVENEAHQVCAVRAALPQGIVAQEESSLAMARGLVPRIPFPGLQLLIVDELGKNISGAGMDTKVIGRGVELQPGEAPEIRLIYVRDVTAESGGNAVGVGFADLIHERLFRKIDFEKMYINIRTSLNPEAARLPMYSASDRDALNLALGHLGSPDPGEQSIVWIRDTLQLSRIAISARLAREAAEFRGWRVTSESYTPEFDAAGNLISVFESKAALT